MTRVKLSALEAIAWRASVALAELKNQQIAALEGQAAEIRREVEAELAALIAAIREAHQQPIPDDAKILREGDSIVFSWAEESTE